MEFQNEITAKVMGEILAKGMSLSDVDLWKTVDSEAVKTLGKIKMVLSDDKSRGQKLDMVQEIMNEYNV